MTNFNDDDINPLDSDQNEPSSLSLMGGIANGDNFDAADLDITSMDSGGGFLSKGTLLILLIAMIGAGSLYAMRASQTDMTADEKMRKIEADVENKLIEIKGNSDFAANLSTNNSVTDEILGHLSNNATEKQVPVEFTKKNPFVRPAKKVEIKVVDKGPTVDESAVAKQREHEKVLRNLNKELAGLTLKSVLPNGSRSVAVIGNKVVQVGNTVGSFKVTKIANVTVTLTASGQTFSLSLETDNN